MSTKHRIEKLEKANRKHSIRIILLVDDSQKDAFRQMYLKDTLIFINELDARV